MRHDTSEPPALLEEVRADAYRDPDRFARELATVFAGNWLLGPRVDDLPQEGGAAFVAARRPLVATRRDGVVRVFDNVCAHRGSQVVRGRVEGRRLQCPYHGWGYALDGALEAVPGRSRFDGLELAACGLRPLASRVWGGWVWVHASPAPEPFDAWLGPWAEELDRYRLDEQIRWASRSDTIPLNWKAAVDAFNETYHVPFVHQGTVGRLVDGKASTFRYDGIHSRMVIPVRRSLAEAKGRRDVSAGSAATGHGKDLLTEQARDHCNYTLFPNVVLNLLARWGIALVFDPVAVDTTIVHTTMLADPPASDRHAAAYDAQWEEFSKVLDEDLETLAQLAAGMASPAFTTVRLGGEEERLVHFHRVVDGSLVVEG